MDAILTRRSIRKYKNREVPGEIMQEILKAAMAAPSAGNEQPWEFIVITDRKILDEIPRIHPYSNMIKQAPAAIVVCGDMGREKHKGFWIQDCSAATQNILLAARALGLGTVWLGVYPDEERAVLIQKLLGLPENVIPLSIIPVGYPAEEKPPSDRFDSSRIHYNRWK